MSEEYEALKEALKKDLKAEMLGDVKEHQEEAEEVQTQAHLTDSDFNGMGYQERVNLKAEYPKAYTRLVTKD